MSTEYEEKEKYVYLNFQGKVTKLNELFRSVPHINFKMYNLDTEQPLVQINDLLFEGEYDEAIGTNIYFSEVQDPPQPDPCKPNTPINLQYLLHQTSVMNLKRIGPTTGIITKPFTNTKAVDVFFADSYYKILRKHETEQLNIKDYVVDKAEVEEEEEEVNEEPKSVQEKQAVKSSVIDKKLFLHKKNQLLPEWFTEGTEAVENEGDSGLNSTFKRYLELQKLVRQPEIVKKTDPKARIKQNLKKRWCTAQIKRKLIRDLLNSVKDLSFSSENFEEVVDIEKSIKDKIIAPKSMDEFTEEDVRKLLSIRNFNNLSFWGRMVALADILKYYDGKIETESPKSLFKKDRDGLSLLEKYDIFLTVKRKVAFIIKGRFSNIIVSSKDCTEIKLKILDAYESPAHISNIEARIQEVKRLFKEQRSKK